MLDVHPRTLPPIPPRGAVASFVPSAAPLSVVQPLAIFAAGRQSFDCIVRCQANNMYALRQVFDVLPMTENGWNFCKTKIHRVRMSADGFSIWRIERE